ncbi:MAG: hypothetical protein ACREDK_01975 [Thermoplasmata archaeon]
MPASPSPGVALLVYNRNDVAGTARALRSAGAWADETVVVDSSDPEEFRRLKGMFAQTEIRWVRAIPLGCTEPLRPFGLAHVRSEFVVSLDSDEEITPALRVRLAAPLSSDGYFVARDESSIGAITAVLRIYRRSHVHYEGWIHEAPHVEGTIEHLDAAARIVHHADYRRYLEASSRQREYLQLEAWERPALGSQFRAELPGRLSGMMFRSDTSAVSPTAVRLLTLSLLLRPVEPTHPRWGQYRNRWYYGAYLAARARYFGRLTVAEREEAVGVARALKSAGGPIAYLGLDDTTYVAHLTESFPWGGGRANALIDLLRYRYRSGRCLTSWEAPRPPPRRRSE